MWNAESQRLDLCTPTPTHHLVPICALNKESQVMISLKMALGEVTMILCAIPQLYEITG